MFLVLPFYTKQFGNSAVSYLFLCNEIQSLGSTGSLLPDCWSIRSAKKKPKHFPRIFYFDFTISTSLTVTMESCDLRILVYKTPNLLHYDQILYPIVLLFVNTKSNIQGSLTIPSVFQNVCEW